MSIIKVHINNMYIKYTFHFAILLIRQIFGAVPLLATISYAVEVLSFRLGSSFGLLHGIDNPFIALVARFLFVCVGAWELSVTSYWIDTLVLKN